MPACGVMPSIDDEYRSDFLLRVSSRKAGPIFLRNRRDALSHHPPGAVKAQRQHAPGAAGH